jgi:hypothetical protein
VSAVPASPAKIAKQPLAFGMWAWPDLPATRCQITWDGTLGNPAGAPLMFGHGSTWRPITHPAANGTYTTIKDADAAVQAFCAAVAAAEEQEGEDPDAVQP